MAIFNDSLNTEKNAKILFRKGFVVIKNETEKHCLRSYCTLRALKISSRQLLDDEFNKIGFRCVLLGDHKLPLTNIKFYGRPKHWKKNIIDPKTGKKSVKATKAGKKAAKVATKAAKKATAKKPVKTLVKVAKKAVKAKKVAKVVKAKASLKQKTKSSKKKSAKK